MIITKLHYQLQKTIIKKKKYNAQVIYPIVCQGDVIGSVILLAKEQNTKMGESEFKVVQSAAGFLGSQMDI